MINQYVVEKQLGVGSFAKVLLCRDSKTNIQFAIKQMNKKELMRKQTGCNKNAYECVKEEQEVLKRLAHPNIIWLQEIIDDPKQNNIYLVTEYHSKGSLGDQLNKINEEFEEKCIREGRREDIKKMGLNQNHVRLYFIDMLKALHYCHKRMKIIHRDIKPENIGINHNGEAVLIDFGVSSSFEGQ